ncbi:peptidase s16 lon domain-containing protein : Peptidase S16 lon domain protein OS=Pirellula staleyi (strain ATCC 27377 / DSM 6068 / ICPB 4128) GN=Psta_2708 PE=4 SV=1: LON [Tuwongella immobilis]|uniref:Lon N-terminal domain-containing protein n=2 Tax=Tuwongella immobilis TaxID=692036 RepID=A0A6C2YGK9_9BACT|nr:peptidase s16 lon domain-containing protein : Peptidase S16 lon domain protein OS=Pirellula staleyi (strain ATCC 27377 / DSM 6068 / ICPB 4128) GN=Psta_2708 PE=4 SV=1: LON [Tuwongella immobilis]VTR96670.1 peptidase s16 lon domain-containing protein : Peptidase S16 lon domain protein OS=Pirellula staleyi (strain ATCC 27377 / DSM 6068 / ICPB 4128) GN=Psta_2708 PE=4 SV=1: LON [Tuwongella immobilis]
MFPHGVQPLHIFEPRYRQLMADCLTDDRLIALVLLKPGWEPTYDDRPPIEAIACLGEVIVDQKLPDGRYNLLLRGISRIRILEEITTDRLYRTARVDLIADGIMPEPTHGQKMRSKLRETVMPRFQGNEASREQLEAMFDGEMALGTLLDILAFALPIPLLMKQALLEQTDVLLRGRMLLDILTPKSDRPFPPTFSPN